MRWNRCRAKFKQAVLIWFASTISAGFPTPSKYPVLNNLSIKFTHSGQIPELGFLENSFCLVVDFGSLICGDWSVLPSSTTNWIAGLLVWKLEMGITLTRIELLPFDVNSFNIPDLITTTLTTETLIPHKTISQLVPYNLNTIFIFIGI